MITINLLIWSAWSQNGLIMNYYHLIILHHLSHPTLVLQSVRLLLFSDLLNIIYLSRIVPYMNS